MRNSNTRIYSVATKAKSFKQFLRRPGRFRFWPSAATKKTTLKRPYDDQGVFAFGLRPRRKKSLSTGPTTTRAFSLSAFGRDKKKKNRSYDDQGWVAEGPGGKWVLKATRAHTAARMRMQGAVRAGTRPQARRDKLWDFSCLFRLVRSRRRAFQRALLW